MAHLKLCKLSLVFLSVSLRKREFGREVSDSGGFERRPQRRSGGGHQRLQVHVSQRGREGRRAGVRRGPPAAEEESAVAGGAGTHRPQKLLIPRPETNAKTK